MSSPYYVSPEQLMRDKAEFALAGISRGRAIVVIRALEGVLFVAHNPGAALKKLSEVYDRIGFAAVGRYSEFEALRKAGVRHADVTGYSYSREDVSSKSLADGYSQSLGNIFAQEMKPMEVELVVAEVGSDPARDEIYRISFDGSIAGEGRFAVAGGGADKGSKVLAQSADAPADLATSMNLCKNALEAAAECALAAPDFEVALLDRQGTGRTFRRLDEDATAALMGG